LRRQICAFFLTLAIVVFRSRYQVGSARQVKLPLLSRNGHPMNFVHRLGLLMMIGLLAGCAALPDASKSVMPAPSQDGAISSALDTHTPAISAGGETPSPAAPASAGARGAA
jgi:hypothetical protein